MYTERMHKAFKQVYHNIGKNTFKANGRNFGLLLRDEAAAQGGRSLNALRATRRLFFELMCRKRPSNDVRRGQLMIAEALASAWDGIGG